MVEKIIELIKEKPYIVPRSFLSHYHDMKLDEKEVILLLYLLNMRTSAFDPKKISHELPFSVMEIVTMMASLSEKDVVKIAVKSNGKVQEERICLDSFYRKLAFYLVEEEKENNTNIFSLFEKEFGRTLSPMEYEIINAWLDSDFKEETILLALREATYNGVSNLRYIDKILHEWKKKGIESKKDIDKERARYKETKMVNKEIMEYDWLNDESN